MKQKEIRRLVGCSHKAFWKKIERKVEELSLTMRFDRGDLYRMNFEDKVNLMFTLCSYEKSRQR